MNTPITMRGNKFNILHHTCTEIKNIVSSGKRPTPDDSTNLLQAVNDLLTEYTCTDVIFTNNTDKMMFGVYVNPTILDSDVINIIASDDIVNLNRYSLEIDTTIFNILDGVEAASYIVEEIASMFLNNTIDIVRNIIDLLLFGKSESIELKQSVNYSQILIFGIKDTMRKVSSIIYKPEDAIGMNKFSEGLEIKEVLVDIAKKVKDALYDEMDITTAPDLGILRWCLNLYKDVSDNYNLAMDTLNDAKDIAGSTLLKREIEKTINSINRVGSETVYESSVILEKMSLFKNLKQSGLRTIEDDYFEYKIRLKNCETEEEAMYILRQVNMRISILEDYLSNTDVTQAEYERWSKTISMFKELRYELGKKKMFNKKQYGIFIDYDKFDQLDKPSSNNDYF